jgi:hypothetical protein
MTIKKIIKLFIPPIIKNILKQKKSDFKCLSKSFHNIRSISKKNKRAKFITYHKLVWQIRRTKINSICHIIASGYSAIHSYKNNIIKKNDFIIGMNFSAFLPYHFDYYFCEDNSTFTNSSDTMIKQINLIKKQKDNIKNIIFKNLYSCKPENFSNNLLPLNFYLLMDRPVFHNVPNSLFKRSLISVAQCASTAITATILAYHAGFNKIIMHGLDFAGPHIYHDLELQNVIGMEAPTPFVNKTTPHISSSVQKSIWPNIILLLERNKVNIFSASLESNFIKYAPLYIPN